MFIWYYHLNIIFLQNKAISMTDLNRIKVVLAENKRTSKWLAEQIGKDVATISKWCTNTSQPSLETLAKIAGVLDVDVRELIVPTDNQKVIMSINSSPKM